MASSRSKRSHSKIPGPSLPSSDRNAEEDKPVSSHQAGKGEIENPHDDEICPICHLLFYRPVKTQCGHSLCESCMLHWADVSTTSRMTIVDLDDSLPTTTPSVIEANCPMCRTPATASLDRTLHSFLKTRYPRLYAQRATEEQPVLTDGSIETITIHIGNTHRHRRSDDRSPNIHDWMFFLRPSQAHIIEEVQIYLHPTFRPSRVIRSLPPYEIHRLGWGTFTVTAHVILKAGYSWVSDDAVGAPDGAERGMLPLEWGLVFRGRGGMGRWRLKVRKEGGRASEEETRDWERERYRMLTAYELDEMWQPLERGQE